jgi:hypothetical protein
MRVGRRTLISAEAAAEWRRRMEGAARDADKRVPQWQELWAAKVS